MIISILTILIAAAAVAAMAVLLWRARSPAHPQAAVVAELSR